MGIIYNLKVFKSRITTVRKSLLILFIISLTSIFVIEFWLINIPGFYNFQYTFGQIFIRLCFSYVAAFIFYFLVVHLPKEQRKVNSYRLLNNKISNTNQLIEDFVKDLILNASNNNGDKLIISAACQMINPHDRVRRFRPFAVDYSNWFNYMNSTSNTVRKNLYEVLQLNDAIDNEVFEWLTYTLDAADHLAVGGTPGNTDMEFWARTIRSLSANSRNMLTAFLKNYRKYDYEDGVKFRHRKIY